MICLVLYLKKILLLKVCILYCLVTLNSVLFFNLVCFDSSLPEYFSFQPVLHHWCNKGCGMCYLVCGMVHIKEPLLLNSVLFFKPSLYQFLPLPVWYERSLMVWWVVGSILHGVDPLSYFSFQPVVHDWCNKGCGMCYPVCGMVHIKEPLLLIDKSSPCGGSGFPLTIWVVLYHMSDAI